MAASRIDGMKEVDSEMIIFYYEYKNYQMF